MFYQDVLLRPKNFPVIVTARYAIFDTDDFNSRIYAYENDLLNSFSVPAYFFRGSRVYLNLRYRGIRNLTLEARIAQTYLSNRDVFGSANDQIDGNVRTEARAQLRYNF